MAIIIQQDATVYVYLYLSIALHVSGGISTHHQELITLYLQYLALIRPLVLGTCHRPVTFTTGTQQYRSH
jgi:hypothetical protein